MEGVTGVNIHNIRAENTGTYGLYPVQSTNVLIENSEVSGVDDAGIYAGQCVNVVMRNNEVYDNVLGIEVENSVGAEIYNNNAHDNTTGILVVLLPQLTSQVSLNTKVFDNVLDNNNLENFAKEGTAAAIMPAGAGIAIIAADQVEVYGNTISNHKTAGIGIFSLTIAYDANEIDIGPTPENIYIHDNFYQNNGYEADEFIASLGIPGSDILWDVSGWNVRVDEDAITSFPPLMPSSNWSDFFYRMYWQILNFITQYI